MNLGRSCGPLKAAPSLLALVLMAGCGSHRPPTPVPTPTPPAPSASLLLGRSGTTFTDPSGKPVDLKGTARCCTTEDSEVCDPGWALVSRCAIQDTATRAGGGLIHLRLGPYRVQPDWGPEQNSAGSPYLEVGGKADLTQWDPRFESYLDDKASFAASLGVRLEVDIADGWGLKWQKWRPNQFPQGHPWVKSSNLQGEDWITSSGTSAPVGVHEAWIRHAVDMLGEHQNIIWQVGNENDQIPGIVAEWEIGTCNLVHDQEAKRGFKRHLCGSNVPALAANRAEIDYLTTHADPPFTQLKCGDLTRPCVQNEDNNRYSGQLWGSLYCDAKAKGLYRHLWRAEMSRADFDLAFTFLKDGCSGATPAGCYDIPNEDAIQVLPKPPARQQVVDATNAALQRLFPSCSVGSNCQISEPLDVFLPRFAAEVRKDPLMCAGVQTTPEGPVDEACVGLKVPGTDRCDECQGQHVFACKTGCTTGTVSWAPGSYARASDTWRRPGAAATMSSASTGPRAEPDWRTHRDKTLMRGRRPAVPNVEP